MARAAGHHREMLGPRGHLIPLFKGLLQEQSDHEMAWSLQAVLHDDAAAT